MTVKTPYYSYRNKQLCKGCKQCVKGRKLVLFVTGLCSRNCFYCPLSERKYKKDVVCANEWEIQKPTDILYEAKMCGSTGAGITGGDPLLKLDRTIKFIKILIANQPLKAAAIPPKIYINQSLLPSIVSFEKE